MESHKDPLLGPFTCSLLAKFPKSIGNCLCLSKKFQLNKDKTEIVLFRNKEAILLFTACLESRSIKTTTKAKTLDVIVDEGLSFREHIN